MSKNTTSKTDKTKNLVPQAHVLTVEEASKGGKRSVEARKEKKMWKEEIAKRLGTSDFDEIIDNLIERAKSNTRDFEILRDTMGQKPTVEMNITGTFDFGSATLKDAS